MQYWVLTAAAFTLPALQGDLARPAVFVLFALIAGSMFVVGLWLEHRRQRFAVDLSGALVMLSAGPWLLLLSAQAQDWIFALQVLGLANVALLAGLYVLQHDLDKSAATHQSGSRP